MRTNYDWLKVSWEINWEISREQDSRFKVAESNIWAG